MLTKIEQFREILNQEIAAIRHEAIITDSHEEKIALVYHAQNVEDLADKFSEIFDKQ